jgi:predicted PurR-regulated permease PerM
MQNNINSLFLVISGIIFFGAIYLLAPILTPFLVAALLAYLSDPLVEKLKRWKFPRLVSVILVFALIFGLIILSLLLLVPLIQKEIVTFSLMIPNIIAWIQNSILPWLDKEFGIKEGINLEALKSTLAANWTKAGSVASVILKTILQSGKTVVVWITNLLLIPVVTFYLLRDWNTLLMKIRGLLPRKIEPTVVKLVKECDMVLSSFFRGQLLVMTSLAIIYSAGLTMIGLQIGVIIGLIAGLMSIVPYLGFIIGIVSASIAAYIQFGDITSVLWVLLVFMAGQAADSLFLTPVLVGDRIGLHPVAVIFAVLVGGSLFGFFGVLLALPVAAVIMVWLRFLNKQYRDSRLYHS